MLADEHELIKLLLPVLRPAKTRTYLKRVVTEKWDEVHGLKKRGVIKMDDRGRQDRGGV
jgi:hypothetical protein